MRSGRKLGPVLALALVLALVGAACGKKAPTAKTGGILVFGASADPVTLDAPFVSDGESIRAIYQIMEPLVVTKLGGFDPVPKLAKSWTASTDGLAWTFSLQAGVKFHDGTDFNAQAVCFNFDRWYHFKGLLQSDSISYYYGTVFGAFSDKPGKALYKSCEAKDANTAVINLTHPFAAFLSAMTLPAFSIQSPTALQKYNADQVSGTADSPTFSTYGLEHPVGTGPFKFDSFTPKSQLVLLRNDGYWGEKAKLDKVIIKPIADGSARRQALETGELQAYDNVSPEDIDSLKAKGFQVITRSPFNVGYVGFNVSKPPLNNLKIRQAIAYALNREALVKAKYAPGAVVANEFMPPGMFGYADDVTQYVYNQDKAKALIAESGISKPTLEFWYPTSVSRGYMPDPAANFQAFKSDLEKVGFTVKVHSEPWRPGYVQKVTAGDAPVYLFGWLADFGDPENFIGTFFRTEQDQWMWKDAAWKAVSDKLEEALKVTDVAQRTKLYQDANKLIMDYLPGVPYVHTGTFVGLSSKVQGYVPSPISLEPFSTVSLAS